MSSNVLSRLAKLGSAMPSRRRIVGPSEMEEEESYVPDISDVSSIPVNSPTPTAEGGIAPESYDVRANEVIQPTEAEPNLHEKVGRALGELARDESAVEATAEAAAQKPTMGADNVGAGEGPQRQQPGFWSRLGSSLNNLILDSGGLVGQGIRGISNEVARARSPEGREEMARNLLAQEEKYPNLKEAYVPEFLGGRGSVAVPYAEQNAPQVLQERQQAAQSQQENFSQQISEAMENPWTSVAYGSADEISRSPELQAQVSEIAGINWEPQIAEQVKHYEAALDEIANGYRATGRELNSQVEAIKQRIENNQATDMDKWYVGLSLLLPLVVGGFFGAEAGLAALGGAAQGLAQSGQQRQKDIRADQEAIGDLAKLQIANQENLGNLELKKASLPESIRKMLPKDTREHLIGQEEVTWTDPKTGKEKRGIKIREGLVVPAQKVGDEKRLERYEKAADKLAEERVYADQINDMTDDIIEIASKLKDKNALLKAFAGAATKTLPGSLSYLTEDIDWDGRRVNAGQLLEQKIGFLANAYAQSNKLGQLDRAAQAHIDRLILNPTKTLNSPQDSITQMLEVRKLVQRGILRSAQNAGFDTDFLASDLGVKNRALNDRLNSKENQKIWKDRKELLTE